MKQHIRDDHVTSDVLIEERDDAAEPVTAEQNLELMVDGEARIVDHEIARREPALGDVRLDEGDPMEFVRQFMNLRRIEVLFDGSLSFEAVPLRADSPDMVDEFLSVEFINAFDLADQMLLHCKQDDYDFSKGDIERALRQVMRAEKHERRNKVMRPLLIELPAQEQELARQQWAHLGERLFEMDAELAVAILRHFVWQLKQKVLGRAVVHHLMPVVFNPIQGSGKTTFVRKFLSPLRELATGAALLSDFTDRRSEDIYRFPAVFIDDVEQIKPASVTVLKALLTADGIRRRRLGTSMTVGVRQAATPIGTSNTSIERLITDETGHRRFAMMPFRNGQTAKGGDGDVWKIVSSADYNLLWRSVDTFAPSPIMPHLESLFRHQGDARPSGSLLGWLRDLNLQSEPMRRITTRQGVRAEGLRAQFRVQTGEDLTQFRFSKEMERHLLDPAVPFDYKVRTELGALYRVKRRSSDESGGVGSKSRPPAPSAPSASSAPSAPSVSSASSA